MLLSVAVFRPHFVLDGWTTQKHPGDVLRRRDAPRFERDRRALGSAAPPAPPSSSALGSARHPEAGLTPLRLRSAALRSLAGPDLRPAFAHTVQKTRRGAKYSWWCTL